MTLKQIAICAALVVSSGPAWAATAIYQCTDGTSVKAVFTAPGPHGTARLIFAGKRPVVLMQAPSADGGRYVHGDMEFWIKGNTARLTRGQNATDCQAR